jgi:hypothetical protein
MIVVPVRDDQQFYGLRDVDTESAQVFKRNGFARPAIYTRVNYYPFTGAKMKNDALADAWSEEGDFKFV